VVRVVFPDDPRDDGFVQGGGRSYQTAEVFAGFADQYRFQYSNYNRYHGVQPDAYDGNGGYLFIVASWRPMHFERLADGDQWQSFEVTSEAYVRDPRPAIHELASVLAGDTGEGYTVRFATYFNSQDLSPFAPYAGFASFGLSSCSASYFGWGTTIPWSYLATTSPWLTTGFGGTFVYRGRRYAYDSLRDCAVALPYNYIGYGYYRRYASGPSVPRTPTRPVTGQTRTLNANDAHRDPFNPKPPLGRIRAGLASDAGASSQGTAARLSPEYRSRGLITDDRPETQRPKRGIATTPRTQPVNQEPLERRARPRTEEPPRMSAPPRTEEPPRMSAPPRTEERPRVSRPRTEDTPRASAPSRREESPRTSPPHRAEPRSREPRSSEPPSTSKPRTRTPPPSESRPTP
jgi:hypothetical protein